MKIRAFYISCLICLLMACNVGRKLPAGTQLYKGANYEISKDKENKASERTIKRQLKKITTPRPNKSILGFPYKVWMWYFIGEPKKQKGLKYWLRNRFGEAPVLSTMVNTKANSENLQNYLENKGYFKTSVSGDTVVKGYTVRANYTIKLGMPYKIKEVSWVLDTNLVIARDIQKMDARENYLKKDQQYDFDNIKAERIRTDLILKTMGYYYFNPDHVKAWVDSSLGTNQVNIYLSLKDETPKQALLPQSIRQIVLFPNYTLIEPPPDTSRSNMDLVDQIFIRDTVKQIKATTLVKAVTYRPGALYSIQDQNKTLNRFINMGVFKFVKNRYESNRDTASTGLLNVYYYLTPLKKKTLSAEIGTFTKSNSYTGGQFNLNWKNRNLFGGAEQLILKGYLAGESSFSDSLKRNNNYRIGGEASLLIPRFIAPFRIKESNFFPPKTRFSLAYELLRRQELFTKNFFRLQYDLTWKQYTNKEHTLSPLSISYNNTTNSTPIYLAQLAQLSTLRYSNLPEVIIGSFYNFTFNSVNPNSKNIFYLNTNLDVAGTVTGLINKASAPLTNKLLDAFYAQYAKLDAVFHYSRRLGEATYWANRLNIGIGLPYGNSAYLPFSKQFIAGGASSLRGFRPRQVGPGRVQTTPIQQVFLPQVGGEYKLEMNTELRFPFINKLKGAVFMDAGNIWTKDTLIYGKLGQFSKSFLRDIAIDAGVGLRLDISLLIIRVDLAAPLRKPWLPRGQEWVIRDINPFKSSWRRENLILNIGIGYPF